MFMITDTHITKATILNIHVLTIFGRICKTFTYFNIYAYAANFYIYLFGKQKTPICASLSGLENAKRTDNGIPYFEEQH